MGSVVGRPRQRHRSRQFRVLGAVRAGHRPAHGRDGRHRVRARVHARAPVGPAHRTPARPRGRVVARHRARRAGAEQLAVLPSHRPDGSRTRGRGDRPRGTGPFGRVARLLRRRRWLVHRRGGRQHRLLRPVRVPHLWARPRRVGFGRPRRRRALRRARPPIRTRVPRVVRARRRRVPVRSEPDVPHGAEQLLGCARHGRRRRPRLADGARSRVAPPPLVEHATDQRPRRRALGRLRLRQPQDERVLQLRRLAVLVHEGVHHARRPGRPSVLDRARSRTAAARDGHAADAGHGDRPRRRPGGRAGRATARLVVRRAERGEVPQVRVLQPLWLQRRLRALRDGRHRLDARRDRPRHRAPPRPRRGDAQRGRRRCRVDSMVTAARRAHRHRGRGRRALARAGPPHHHRPGARAVGDRLRAPPGTRGLRHTRARRSRRRSSQRDVGVGSIDDRRRPPGRSRAETRRDALAQSERQHDPSQHRRARPRRHRSAGDVPAGVRGRRVSRRRRRHLGARARITTALLDRLEAFAARLEEG